MWFYQVFTCNSSWAFESMWNQELGTWSFTIVLLLEAKIWTLSNRLLRSAWLRNTGSIPTTQRHGYVGWVSKASQHKVTLKTTPARRYETDLKVAKQKTLAPLWKLIQWTRSYMEGIKHTKNSCFPVPTTKAEAAPFHINHTKQFQLGMQDTWIPTTLMTTDQSLLARSCWQLHFALSQTAAPCCNELGLTWDAKQISYLNRQEWKEQKRFGTLFTTMAPVRTNCSYVRTNFASNGPITEAQALETPGPE